MLHILPAEQVEAAAPISPVRTLKGHTRTVTDTAIVSKGKNVLSSAKVLLDASLLAVQSHADDFL